MSEKLTYIAITESKLQLCRRSSSAACCVSYIPCVNADDFFGIDRTTAILTVTVESRQRQGLNQGRSSSSSSRAEAAAAAAAAETLTELLIEASVVAGRVVAAVEGSTSELPDPTHLDGLIPPPLTNIDIF